VVNLLLKREDVSANLKDDCGQSPLCLATIYDCHNVVRLLLELEDVIAEPRNNYGRTPLSLAAGLGHKEIVKPLLEQKGVSADSKDNHGITPLSWAAAFGREEVTKQLLDRKGVAADSKDNYGHTPLSWAARRGQEKVVQLLLEMDDVAADSEDHYGQTPPSWASENEYQKVVALLLERENVAADAKDNIDQTPLSWAAERGHERVVKLLLQRETADVNSQDIWEQLLDHEGIDAGAKNSYSQTPLWWLAAYGVVPLVKRLVGRASVSIIRLQDDFGQTPLFGAAAYGNASVVKLLLELGGGSSLANVTDTDGRTPLLLAAKNGHEAVVKLLAGRADVDSCFKDSAGRSAYSWAVKEGHDAVKLLFNQAVANSGGDDAACPQQLPAVEPKEPLAVSGNQIVGTATDNDAPLHSNPDNKRPQMVRTLLKASAPNAKRARTTSSRAGKRPTRPRRQTGGATMIHVGRDDRTVRLCTAIGERGSTASVFVSAAKLAGGSMKEPEMAMRMLALSAANDASPSAKLALTVRMAAPSPLITVMRA
jgi:ankyrin repeat protein